ncbi:MAG: nucleotidyltransferase family protein [Bacteroidota bacterium]
MEIIILAGARNDGALRECSASPYEAGIVVGGKTLLDYVVGSLAGLPEIGRLVVVGPEGCLSAEARARIWRLVPPGGGMVENLRRGLATLGDADKVLVATADIPLLTREAVEHFIARCREREADVYYPVVRREPIETRFPGVRRTYAKLREGTFTGGNIMLLSPEVVARHVEVIEKVVAFRKSTLQMAKLLGFWYLLKLLAGRLSIKEIERRIEQKLRFRGAAIITPYAEIGIDVDKPSDLELVRRALIAGEASAK